MLLTVLKHGGNWDFLAQMFKVKGPTFEKIICRFMNIVWEVLYELTVEQAGKQWKMSQYFSSKKTFKNFKYARYATDVTFLNTNRPSGNLQEAKSYYSGKHKLYGCKVEVSMPPTGQGINCSKHYPGTVSDIDIFYESLYFHEKTLRKKGNKTNIVDDGLLVNDHEDQWLVLVDKGYQGATAWASAIHSKKKQPHRMLSL